jgi:tellurite resistance protein TerC
MDFSHGLLWAGFAVLIVGVMALDLGVLNRNPHETRLKEALTWSGVWISLGLLFSVFVYFFLGFESAVQYVTGYLVEESLSVDNLFVFLLIFTYFGVPARFQHKILFWGIIGAVVLRALFIVAGVTLIQKFHWVIYVFGAFLVFTGLKLARQGEQKVDPGSNPLLKLFRKLVPVGGSVESGTFLVRENGRLKATPLMAVLIAVETTDLVFAVDSIPAVLAVSTDPFIVYTSNVFAILGLRSLYFALAGIMGMFTYLRHGLVVVLTFVGVKMLLSDIFHIPALAALGVIVVVLGGSVVLSVLKGGKRTADGAPPDSVKQ